MTAPRNLKTIAGCPTRILVSITAPEATDTELTAYVNSAGTPIAAAVQNGAVTFPPLPEGEHLYEIRCGGKPVAWGHLLARPTAYPLQPSDVVDWELAADLTATDAAQITLTLTPGPQGPKGDPGDITLDELPQENSTNFVTSGSVYTYVNYASSVILASMQEFYDDYWAHSNNSYQEKHVTAAQLGILSSLQSGSYGSAGVSGSLTLLQGGIALNSPNATVKVEVRNSGLVLTSSSAPQWLDAATSQFYNLRTTKDLTIDDSDFLGLSNRTAALENAPSPAAFKLRTITYKNSAGQTQLIVYFGENKEDFIAVEFPGGFTIGGTLYSFLSRAQFDALATTSGSRKTITGDAGSQLFYEPTATGGNAIFSVFTEFNGCRGGIAPNWSTYVPQGAIQVGSLQQLQLSIPITHLLLNFLAAKYAALEQRISALEANQPA